MSAYIATLFVAPSSESEVLGTTASSLVQNVRADHIQPILSKHGLEVIEADKWYPMQIVLDVFKDIVESRENVVEDLVAVGIKTVETAPLPPTVNSVESALVFIDQAAKLTSRHVPPEFGAPLRVVEAQHALVTNNIPYPNQLLYGYIWGLVNRVKAPDHIFSIQALPDEPAKPTVFSVRWGLPDELEEASDHED